MSKRDLAAGAVAFLVACAQAPTTESSTEPATSTIPIEDRSTARTVAMAPLLEGIGPIHLPISTDSELAQKYFDQALTLTWGFNHAEAVRSFREAARNDPTCGICYWGVALALGPNINMAMQAQAQPEAFKAVQQALTLRGFEDPWEQAYIDAIATRYAEPGGDRAALDMIYAGAMKAVLERYPTDLHAATLYAEALMDLSPWNYWNADGSPREHTEAFVAQLERVMEADPSHPGALHLYVHAMEQYTPERAEDVADRLGPLVPVAGHLVHMPSHIYLRVGRYHDAVTANAAAAEADEDYITQCGAQGFYPAAYYPHNIHFLWYSAMMEGRKALAIESARKLVSRVPIEAARTVGIIQRYLAAPITTAVRFGLWDEALEQAEMPDGVPYASAIRHYGRGIAFAAKGDVASAQAELDALVAGRDGIEEAVMMRDPGVIYDLMDIAINLVSARIARTAGESNREIAHLQQAVAKQDGLAYTEPPFWHYPVRHSLGDAYLRLGDTARAASVFRQDLEKFPNNGWSLYGLELAGVTEVRARRMDAWQYADIEPIVTN